MTKPRTELGAELNAARTAPVREVGGPDPEVRVPQGRPGRGARSGTCRRRQPDARHPQVPLVAGQPLLPATTRPGRQVRLPGLRAFGPLGPPVQRLRLPGRASLQGEQGRWGHKPRPSGRKGSWWGPNAARLGSRARGLLGAAAQATDTTARRRRTPGTEANSSHGQEGSGSKDRPRFSGAWGPPVTPIGVCRGDPLSQGLGALGCISLSVWNTPCSAHFLPAPCIW